MPRRTDTTKQAEYDKHKEIYRLYAAGYSYTDIGLYLGISQPAVTQQIQALRAKYPSLFGTAPNARIERYCPGYHDNRVKQQF